MTSWTPEHRPGGGNLPGETGFNQEYGVKHTLHQGHEYSYANGNEVTEKITLVAETALSSASSKTAEPIKAAEAEKIDASIVPKLAIKRVVARPERSNVMDETMRKKWIAAHPPDMQEAVRELSEKVIHVSQEEFEESLHTSMLSFKEKVKDKPDFAQKSIVIVAPGKSNSWVYQLAKESGVLQEQLPQDSEHVDPFEEEGSLHSESVILFDDAIYSGHQMAGNIIAAFKDCSCETVYLIAPFTTEIGKKNIESAVSTYLRRKGILTKDNQLSDFLFISDHKIMPTVSEVLSEKTIKVLDAAYWPKDSSNQSRFERGAKTRAVVYFDHKVGDDISFPLPLAKGLVVDHDGNAIPAKDITSPIPRTIPPYRIS